MKERFMQKSARFLAASLVAAAACTGFAEDAYVQTSSSAFINTGFHPSGRARVELDFELVGSTTDQQRPFATDADGSAGYKMTIYRSGGNFAFAASDDWQGFGTGIPCDNVRHTAIIDAPNRRAYLVTGSTTNKEVVLTSPVGTRTSPHALILGGRTRDANGASIDCPSPMKVYGFKVWEDGELVRDMRPRLQGGKVGLKDLVTGVFVEGAYGLSGELGSGGDLEEVEDDAYVATIGDTGLNSRFFTCPDAKVELDYAFDSMDGILQARMMGTCGDPSAAFEFYIGGSGPSAIAGDGSGKGAYSGKSSDLRRHTAVIDCASRRFTLKGGFATVFTGEVGATTKTGAYPIAIAARSENSGSRRAVDGEAFRQMAKLRVYGMRCWKGGALVHDYAPVVQGGVPGLKDRVDGAFITTGTMLAGGAIGTEAGPAFIESTNQDCSIDTGTHFGPNTRVEADFAFVSTSDNPQQFVFEACSDDTCTRFYSTGGQISYICQDLAKDASQTNYFTRSEVPMRPYVRRFGVLDGARRISLLTTAGFTNCFNGAVRGVLTKTCQGTTKIFANNVPNGNYAKMRLYGFRIWENGELVRDYVPCVRNGVVGLRDRVGGGFVCHSDTKNAHVFTAGGDIEVSGPQDAYLESNGTQYIDTGYRMTPASRLECDFQLTAVSGQLRMFGPCGDTDKKMYAELYTSGDNKFNIGYGDTWKTYGPLVPADVSRHKAVIDGLRRMVAFDDWSAQTASTTYDNTSDNPVGVFCRITSTSGTSYGGISKMKLFSFRIYENDVLVHEYLPCRKGEVVGLYDTVAKVLKTDKRNSATPFTCGGAGWDGSGAAKGIHTPPRPAKVSSKNPETTLSVFAPGAVAYRWTRNGETIADATGDVLTVGWNPDAKTDVYAVAAVFELNGRRVESDPAEAVVTSLPRSMAVFVR